MQEQLGQTIKKYRHKKSYTILELADILKISTGLLSNIENGKSNSFQLNLLNNIINELDIPLSELNLFTTPYSFEESKEVNSESLNKIKPSIDKLIPTFISHSYSFTDDELSLLTDMIITELNSISKLIELTKSK